MSFRKVLAAIARMVVLAMACALAATAQPTPTKPAQSPPPSPVPVRPEADPNGAAADLATGQLAPLGAIAAYEGLSVASIHFEGPPPDDHQRLLALVEQPVGAPLDKRKVRESLRNLYATGRFADVEVQAQRQRSNEVVLVFRATENYFIGAVQIEGVPDVLRESQLINATKLELGELFTEEKVEAGLGSMKDVLEDYGYYQAQVEATYTDHPDTQQKDVALRLVPGERARIGAVRIIGDAGLPEEELRRTSKLKSGKHVEPSRVTRALRRLRSRFQKKDRLVAEVSLAERKYQPQTNTVDYLFRIDRGPTVDIHLQGAKLRKGLLKKYVPVYEENAVDDSLLSEGRRNLRDYFQTKGYFDVDVAFTQEREGDHLHVIYEVERGERHRLKDIAIEGNVFFSDEDLLERMQIEEAGWLLFYGRFSQSMLNADVQAIEDLYHSNGFRDVKVRTQVLDDFMGEEGRMKVVITVEDGPQTRVKTLTITGNASVDEDYLRAFRLNMTEGQPFSEFNKESDRSNILNHYYDEGFLSAAVEITSRPDEQEPNRMHVTYTIQEGPRTHVDRILMSGLHFTRPFVAEREFTIRDGEPLSQSKQLKTQQNLYDLGLFNQVETAVQNPDGDATYKNLLVHFDEANRYTFHYGIGFEFQTGSSAGGDTPQGDFDFSPRFSFNVTRLNFRGRNHTVNFGTRLSRLQQRALASYEAPRWFDNRDLKMTLSAFYDTSRDVRTFTSKRIEGAVTIEHQFQRDFNDVAISTLLYRFSYRRVSVDAETLAIDPNLPELPLFARPARIGMPGISYIRDKRSGEGGRDVLNPIAGNYTTADFGVSSRIFGSEASFARFAVQNSTYHAFGKARRRWVFARSTRLGFADPFGADVIPLPERFFAGGGSSHRGFSINQAGPRDAETGFPLGGNALFLNNLELRTPSVFLPFVGENLSFVLFHDAGNVFETVEDLGRGLFRMRQRPKLPCQDPTSTDVCNFNYLAQAVGLGLRYRTPVGPVRVDFGYNLNPATFPIRSEGRVETLRRFNFYFSIGPTF